LTILLSHTAFLQIETLLATFSMEIVLAPRVTRAGGSVNYGSCLDIIVGHITCMCSYVTYPAGDELDDFPDDVTFTHRRVRRLDQKKLELSDEQRMQFKQFVNALGLESSAARRVRVSKSSKMTLAKAEALETKRVPAAHKANPANLVWNGRAPKKAQAKVSPYEEYPTGVAGGNIGTGTSYLEPKLIVVHAANRANPYENEDGSDDTDDY
jgi:hypothetical protein